jgi:tetratricopeptide (TPR) repeat protein
MTAKPFLGVVIGVIIFLGCRSYIVYAEENNIIQMEAKAFDNELFDIYGPPTYFVGEPVPLTIIVTWAYNGAGQLAQKQSKKVLIGDDKHPWYKDIACYARKPKDDEEWNGKYFDVLEKNEKKEDKEENKEILKELKLMDDRIASSNKSQVSIDDPNAASAPTSYKWITPEDTMALGPGNFMLIISIKVTAKHDNKTEVMSFARKAQLSLRNPTDNKIQNPDKAQDRMIFKFYSDYTEKDMLLASLAGYYDITGNDEKAISTYQEVARLHPDDHHIYDNMGRIYEQKKDYKSAIKYYQMFIDGLPKCKRPPPGPKEMRQSCADRAHSLEQTIERLKHKLEEENNKPNKDK